MLSRFSTSVAALALVVGLAPTGAAAPANAPTTEPARPVAEDPWGPPRLLVDSRTKLPISQATTSDGVTVVVFREQPRLDTPSVAMVAIRQPDGRWSETARLVDDQRGRGAKVVAWGDGQLSVVYSRVTDDRVRFHERALTDEGTLGPPTKLTRSPRDASPYFEVAINNRGQMALAFAGSDQHDRVLVRQLDGAWSELPPLPVLHPGPWGRRIQEPRALFLDDLGRAATFTWGVLGSSGEAIWLARHEAGSQWAVEQVQPLISGYVGDYYASYAANARGDIAVISGEREAGAGGAVRLRYAEAGRPLGLPTSLTDEVCWDWQLDYCAGVVVAADGTATAVYPRGAGGDDIVLEMVRRLPDGTLVEPQVLDEPFWRNVFDGVQVVGDERGYSVISTIGRLGPTSYGLGLIRCPPASPCLPIVFADDLGPDSSDLRATSLGPTGEITISWSEDEWPRNGDVWSRQLAAAG